MKFIHVVLSLLAFATHSLAVPASNETFFLNQPNGTSIEVRYIGDEHFHVLETADGYILQEDELGYYAYADESGKSSKIYAQDAQNRSPSDIQFLSRLDQDAIYQKLLAEVPIDEFPIRKAINYGIPKFAKAPIQRVSIPHSNLTIGEHRAMVVLVEFEDVKFKSSDPQKLYTDFLNKEGFNEYANIGSVRDYFIKNSMGKFIPNFDVYGPVMAPGSKSPYGGRQGSKNFFGAGMAFRRALDSLDKKENIDFSKYDEDKDGYIDFLIFIFAGVGAHDTQIKETIWPHAGEFSKINDKLPMLSDGTEAFTYACASEISGTAYQKDSTTSSISGIGLIVHEVGHVLGLHDHYDLYSRNSYKTPSNWDVMDRGNYNCPSNTYGVQNCAPPLLSAFERMSLGWLTPTELNEVGTLKLDKIDTNVAYSITNTKNPDEMFLLEYRTKKGWDVKLPGSGMLIWHIDYVDSVWETRTLNMAPNHPYVDIIDAYPDSSTNAKSSDAFPGSKKVTEFNKFIFWNGDSMKIALSDITESPDKEYVTFTVDIDGRQSSALALSSSSQAVVSSSSSDLVYITYKLPNQNVHVKQHNGSVYIYAPQQGEKTVRIFSPLGALLLEKTMDGKELTIDGIRKLQNSNVILSVTQGHKELFTGMLKAVTQLRRQ